MSWTPESGFSDSRLDEPQYRPIVEETDDGAGLRVDWEHLDTEVKERCSQAGQFYPERLALDRWMFPIPLDTGKVAALFAEKETIVWSNLMFIYQDAVPFLIHTPTLFALMNPTKDCPKYITTSDAICFYYSAVKIFSAIPMDKTLDDNARIQRIADAEYNVLGAAMFKNLLGSGMFQHYFTEKRDPRAGQQLCRELVQYTLRMMQVLERQLLRLSVLGFNEKSTALLGASTAIPEVEGLFGATRELSARFWKQRLALMDMTFSQEYHPDAAPVPTVEHIESADEAHFGASLAYCEAILWYVQSRYMNPDAFAPAPQEESDVKE